MADVLWKADRMDMKQHIEEVCPELMKIRRDSYRHPEPGFEEKWTSTRTHERLDRWRISYEYPVAGTKTAVMIQGSRPGRGSTVALRVDVDALPLTGNPACPYGSINPDFMHACGRDVHMSIALGAARALRECKAERLECMKSFSQPIEETTGGVPPMVETGCMEEPHADYVIGLHMMPVRESGEVEIRHGDSNASSDYIHVKSCRRSCRGAYPDTGADVIVIAAAVINNLQVSVSCCISPLDNGVLTIGTIYGGTVGSIAAGEAEIASTLRTTDQVVRQSITDTMTHIVKCTCQAMGGNGEATVAPEYAILINTDQVVDVLVETTSDIIREEHIHRKKYPSMGVEDFSFFLDKAKSVFYRLGYVSRRKKITAPLHSQDLDMNEACLKLGVEMQARLALRLLEREVNPAISG